MKNLLHNLCGICIVHTKPMKRQTLIMTTVFMSAIALISRSAVAGVMEPQPVTCYFWRCIMEYEFQVFSYAMSSLWFH